MSWNLWLGTKVTMFHNLKFFGSGLKIPCSMWENFTDLGTKDAMPHVTKSYIGLKLSIQKGYFMKNIQHNMLL